MTVPLRILPVMALAGVAAAVMAWARRDEPGSLPGNAVPVRDSVQADLAASGRWK